MAKGTWEQAVGLELIVPAGGEGLQQMSRCCAGGDWDCA